MRVEGEVEGQFSGDCVVSPSWAKYGLAIPYTAVTVNRGRVVTQVTNLSDNFITLKGVPSWEASKMLRKSLMLRLPTAHPHNGIVTRESQGSPRGQSVGKQKVIP